MLNNLKNEAIQLLDKIDEVNKEIVKLMNKTEEQLKKEQDEQLIEEYKQFLKDLSAARNLNIYESIY